MKIVLISLIDLERSSKDEWNKFSQRPDYNSCWYYTSIE